jgi:hypothetical protein
MPLRAPLAPPVRGPVLRLGGDAALLAPVIGDAALSVYETALPGAPVGRVMLAGSAFPAPVFSIVSGNDSGFFAINSVTGLITVAAALTEGVVELVVQAENIVDSDTATITITIEDAAFPAIEDQEAEIEENSANGTTVLDVVATGTPSDLTYEIVSGNDDGLFAIDESTGRITVDGLINYEEYQSHELRVRVSNAVGFAEATISIAVLNVVEDPPVINTGQVFQALESATNGAPVGTVLTTFAPGEAPDSFAITGGNTGDAFAIDSEGNITVAAALDYETTPSYVLTIVASNAAGDSDPVTVTINIIDVQEIAPSIEDDAVEVPEDVIVGQTIYAFIDIIGDPAPVFAITAGNESGKFEINPATGDIKVVATLDYETEDEYVLTVTATNHVDTDTATITITVTDVTEDTGSFDFTTGTMPTGASILRDGPAWDLDASDVLVEYEANEARFARSGETIIGVYCEPERTNHVPNSVGAPVGNALPTGWSVDTLGTGGALTTTVTDDGIENIVDLDLATGSAAGNTRIWLGPNNGSGEVGPNKDVIMSALVKVGPQGYTAGSAIGFTFQAYDSGGSAVQTLNNGINSPPADWELWQVPEVTVGTAFYASMAFRLTGTQASQRYNFQSKLPQIEVVGPDGLAVATTRIPTTNGPVTRAGEVFHFDLPDGTYDLVFNCPGGSYPVEDVVVSGGAGVSVPMPAAAYAAGDSVVDSVDWVLVNTPELVAPIVENQTFHLIESADPGETVAIPVLANDPTEPLTFSIVAQNGKYALADASTGRIVVAPGATFDADFDPADLIDMRVEGPGGVDLFQLRIEIEPDTTPTGATRTIESFGAIGNGVTNDTAAIQAGLNWLKAEGNNDNRPTLIFGVGKTYIIVPESQGGLLLTNAAGWNIQGNGSTLKCANGAPSGPGNNLVRLVNCDFWTVTALHLHGNVQTRQGADKNHHSWRVAQCEDFEFVNCRSDYAVSDGWYVLAETTIPSTDTHFCRRGKWINCSATGCFRQGISFINIHDALVDGGFYSSTSGTDPQAGIDVEPNPWVRKPGTNGPDDPGQPTYAPGVKDLIIRNAVFENNTGAGIQMSSFGKPQDILIENNLIRNNKRAALMIGASYVTVRNNMIRDYTQETERGVVDIPSNSNAHHIDIGPGNKFYNVTVSTSELGLNPPPLIYVHRFAGNNNRVINNDADNINYPTRMFVRDNGLTDGANPPNAVEVSGNRINQGFAVP